MKSILIKQDVAKAIDSLKALGKKPTIQALHSALGNKGSLSTLVKLKAEIEADTVAGRDSEEGLKAFRDVWSLAVEEGRKQKDAELAEMRQALDAMANESQKVEGEVAAANERVDVLDRNCSELRAELAKANERVTSARATSEQNATKLSEALAMVAKIQQNHATEMADLRRQLTEAVKQSHALEIKLARAEAKLEK